LATAAGNFLSTATALFIAIVAGIVSFAETAFTVSTSVGSAASAFVSTGTTFWKPKMCFVSVSTVYLLRYRAGLGLSLVVALGRAHRRIARRPGAQTS